MELLRDARSFYSAQVIEADKEWHSADTCDLCRSRQYVEGLDPVSETASQSSSDSSNFEPPTNDLLTDFLVQRLARANSFRRQQFMYWKAHHEKQVERTQIALAPQGNEISYVNAGLVRPDRHDAALMSNSPVLVAPIEPIAPTITTATRLNPATFVLNQAQSAISVSEYAASNYDSATEIYHLPPPPKVEDGDKFFTCPYCFTVCSSRILSERAWKYVWLLFPCNANSHLQQSTPNSRPATIHLYLSKLQVCRAALRQSR